MFSLPGYTIGDAWFAVNDGVAHCFFCTSPAPDADWHWDIGHAVSRDLRRWEYVGLTLERGADESWDSQTLSTGSVLEWNGRFWLAYSALRRNENPPTRKVHRVGLAVSDDLYTWTKYERNPVNERDPRYYERLGPVHKAYSQWRDPFLFHAGDRVYQYVCARGKSPDHNRRGTVGLASSRDMRTWQAEPPLHVDPIATELEVPQVYRIGGRYYLLFCTSTDRLLPAFKRGFPAAVFATPTSLWSRIRRWGRSACTAPARVLPTDAPVQPYASRLVRWEEQWVLLGTANVGGTRFICDPIAVAATDTGVLTARSVPP